MAPYPIFFRVLKTIIMPNFMLLTESEQLKHISALLQAPPSISQAENRVEIHYDSLDLHFKTTALEKNKLVAKNVSITRR